MIKYRLIQYLDANNLFGQAMFRKLPVGNFEWVTNTGNFNKKFIKNYDENSDKRYIFEVDIKYSKNLHNFHNDLPFLPERVNIKKCNQFACSLHDKNNYVTHVKTLKQALSHGLIFNFNDSV